MRTYLRLFYSPEGGDGGGGSIVTETPPAESAASEAPVNQPPVEGAAGDPPVEKPGEEAPPKEGEAGEAAPLTLEGVKFPEGFEIDTELAQGALDVLNNKELSREEQLQGLVDWYAAQQEATARDWVARNKADGDAIKNDPEIGGANFGASETAFAQLRQEFGSPELDQDLVVTGMGNKLSFAKFLVNIHKVVSEGKPLVGEPTSGEEKTAAQKLYPAQGKV
jgi:hypothetical protein